MTAEIPATVAIDPIFVVEATYAPDAAETRGAFRAEHLARIMSLREAGTILEAGAFADMSGSLLLVRAADVDAAREIAAEDVYMRNGIWVEMRVRPFSRVCAAGEVG